MDPEIQDSAGVRIVTNRAALDSTAFRVGPSPELVIETDPYDSAAVIHWIRGAVRLADKRIVLVTESNKRLMVFDSSGRFLRSIGREGDGPGEFRAPFELTALPGDTLVVSERDSRSRRSWFAPDGRFLRAEALDRHRPAGLISAEFTIGGSQFVPPDQTLWQVNRRYDPSRAPIGVRFRDPQGFILEPPQPRALTHLGWFQSWEYFIDSPQVHRWAFFAPRTVSTAGGSPTRVYVGDAASFDIHAYDEEARLVTLIRDEIPSAPISPRDIEWERWELLSWAKHSAPWVRFADAMPIPDHKPAFEDMLVDREGYLWVKEYGSYKPEPVLYRIYDPTGVRVGAVRLPGRLRVFDIGKDYVLGVDGDVEYVETVRLYALHRPPSSQLRAAAVNSSGTAVH